MSDAATHRLLVVGGSRGVGAAVVRLAVAADQPVLFSYHRRAPYAERLIAGLPRPDLAEACPLDLAEPASIDALAGMLRAAGTTLTGLVIAAAGGMERGAPADYAERLNAAGPWALAAALLDRFAAGARIVLVTSHEAHFHGSRPGYGPYAEIARTKQAGERLLLARRTELERHAVQYQIVSADLIEGSPTAKLLELRDPGLLDRRKAAAGTLPTAHDVGIEVMVALFGPAEPFGHVRHVGSTATIG